MAEKSKIEWTDHTFNPWWGCTKVSAGCKHCYAEALSNRWKRAEWGVNGVRVRTSEANWREPLVWNRKAAAAGRRERVFCASMADVFEVRESHAQCDELQAWREDLFDLITETESLCWLLLTKRPQNILNTMRWWARQGGMEMVEGLLKRVWVGTSVENQAVADERIAHLLDVPAGVRFLSVEPLLGAVDLELYLHGIDWVIVGGESGHNARPMHPDWVRAIRDQCIAAGVPFFFKQWGEWLPLQTADEASQYGTSKMVEAENMRWSKVGKHAAGRMLDGREWNEYPRPST